MKIDILTLFPEMFNGPFSESILKRAQENNLVEIKVHNLRDWTTDKHHTVDDSPYGGGAGMVMRVDIVDKALTDLRTPDSKVILLDTKGPIYSQQTAESLTNEKHLILLCGHYEGLDHRIHEHLVNQVICIGQYVLTGGELPAMVVVDSVVRLLKGVVGNPESLSEESFNAPDHVEYPQYTYPAEYKGWQVPEVLLSGHHKKIKDWRNSN